VTSFVSEILLPILSLLPFIKRNFNEWFAVLKAGRHMGRGYNTMQQALDDGAVIMAYGYVFFDPHPGHMMHRCNSDCDIRE